MLKVLLVDDEAVILQGLQVLINWEAEGYEIAALCKDGREALEYLRTHHVDLVIADVMMPVMTGLELLDTVKREHISEASFVILSGYGEFAFAQQALRLGCMDYLLKPIEKDQLLAILRRSSNATENALMEQKYEQAYLTRNLIALLYGKEPGPDMDFLRKHLRLSHGLRYIEIEAAGEPDPSAEGDTLESGELREQLYQSCRKILEADASHCVMEISPTRASTAIGFLYCDYMAADRGLTEAQYIRQLHRQLGVAVQRELLFLVGRRVQDVEQISASYESAGTLRNLVAFRGPKPIYWYEQELQEQTAGSVLLRQELDALVEAVERGEHMLIEQKVNLLFDRMQSGGMKHRDININFNYLLFRLVHLASSLDGEANQEEILQLISDGSVEQGFRRGSRNHLTRFAWEYADYLGQLRRSEPSGILKNIEREIRENYAENLSLQSLGKKYYINSSYLGQIFRKAYGQSFRDYLTMQRINEAAHLLLQTDRKIGDIAESVGYRDIDYFISRFIEIKGCTPSRYRKSRS